MSESKEIPLCVDLDGTLCKGDLTVESCVCFLKKDPFLFLKGLPLLLRGKAPFKRLAAQHVLIDVESLPWNGEFLSFLGEEHARGRPLYLVSASDEILVKQVGDYHGIFLESVGSDGSLNLRSKNKLDYLVKRFGSKGFDYAGNDAADYKVWEGAHSAVVVNASPSVSSYAKKHFDVSYLFEPEGSIWSGLFKSLRAYQWLKSLLIFIPLILAHRFFDPHIWFQALIAFFAFCFCASAIYVVNDVFDLESDRVHKTKKRRPLAAGDISVGHALGLCIGLFVLAALLSIFLTFSFRACLLLYAVCCIAYSFRLKRYALIDIFMLASFYVLRVLSGGVAVGVEVSHWLLGFSMFFFLSLACVKRYAELLVLRSENRKMAHGRGYTAGDLEQIAIFGASSGYLSVVVLAMYISSKEVSVLYSKPGYLWILCPLILYWISRVWLLAHRGKVHEDPVLYAAGDRASYVVALLSVILVLISM